ncbi:MAG: hypothetical protein IKM01_03155 [Clostridia bacterium]|nr:hypothetical protein [Clostridia bacterium]
MATLIESVKEGVPMAKTDKKNRILRTGNVMLSSFLMLLLLFVGLSTATLAWFSANNRVGSGTIVFEARTDAGGNITIGWEKDSLDKTIELPTPSAIGPMVPKYLPDVNNLGESDSTYWDSMAHFRSEFHSASIDRNNKFVENGKHAVPYSAIKEAHGFYIINHDSVEANIRCYAKITGENADLLRIALFTRNGTASSVDTAMMRFEGLMMTDNATFLHYGTIEEGKSGDEFTKFPDVSKNADVHDNLTFKIGPNTNNGKNVSEIFVVAWYDGVLLNEEKAIGSDGSARTALLELEFVVEQ